MDLPEVVPEAEWRSAREQLLVSEKEATRISDALAAKRRRLPMTQISSDYAFDGPGGQVGFVDLFEGRRQLVLYHFWFPPGGDPCSGCSMFTDQIGELAHLHARDTSLALVSRAPQAEIEPFKRRMGWTVPWYTVAGEEFQRVRGTSEYFSLDVYLRDGECIYLSYETRGRGVESLGPVWSFLDLTPLGRQEEWEDTPAGRPQGPPYRWWRLHDEYNEEKG